MGTIVDHKARARKGEDFLAGRCCCPTCDSHARTYHPERYAQWCRDRDQPVPEEVVAAIDALPLRLAEEVARWRPPYAVLGVDLGKRTDHSAIAVVVPGDPADQPAGVRWRIPSVNRLPLAGDGEGSHYMKQAELLAKGVGQVLDVVTGHVWVLVDATGVGDAVAEMIAAQLPATPRVQFTPVVITGGRTATHAARRWAVSKTALIGPTTAALEQNEIQFGEFRDAAVVRRELLAYRVKPSSVHAGPERLEADRQSDHDDTVIAVAMAVYAARRQKPAKIHSPVRTSPGYGWPSSLYHRRLGGAPGGSTSRR